MTEQTENLTKFREMWKKEYPDKPYPFTKQAKMKKKRDLYVRQLRADAEGLFEQASELEKNWLDDFDDYKLIENQLPYIEQIGAEVNELWEDISVLSKELKEYIDADLTEAELQEFEE